MDIWGAAKSVPIQELAKDLDVTITNPGADYAMAICPFHEDHKGGGGQPNLSLSKKTNGYKCHKCGAKGSPIDFVAELMKLEPIGAAQWLVEKYKIPYDDPLAKPKPKVKKLGNPYYHKTWDAQEVEVAHGHLLQPAHAEHLEHFLKLRHLSVDYVKAKKIGLAQVWGVDRENEADWAYTIPAFDTDGSLRCIRVHSRYVRKNKTFIGAKKMVGGSDYTILYDLTSYQPTHPELWIVEGEGDFWTAEHLLKKNAVTGLSGSSSIYTILAKNLPELGDLVARDRIVLCNDNDTVGLLCMARLRTQMPKDAKVYRIYWPDNYPAKEDLSYWFYALGRSYTELEAILHPYSFHEAQEWLKKHQEMEEAKKNPNIRVFEYGNAYWRKAPKMKGKEKKLGKAAPAPPPPAAPAAAPAAAPEESLFGPEGAPEELLPDVAPIEEAPDVAEHDAPEEEQVEDIRISTFVIHANATVEVDRQGFTRADIKTIYGSEEKNVILPPETWLAKREFMKNFPHTKYVFTGTDKDVQDIMQLATKRIQNKTPKKGVKYIGFVGDNFVGPGFAISKTGPLDDSPYEYIPQHVPFDTGIKLYPGDDVASQVQAFAETILKVNKPDVIVPTIGWMFACFFKDQVQRLIHYFPILSFFGTSGAGKTSLVVTLLRIFGLSSSFKLFNANATRFSTMKMLASTNCIPVAVDELKENIGRDTVHFWQQRMKNVYFGEIETRGNKDQGVTSYEYMAPLCICGEMSIIREQAIAERTIAIRPERHHIDTNKEAKAAYLRLDKDIALNHLFPKIIQWRLGLPREQIDEAWEQAKEEIATMKLPRLASRVWGNYVTVVFGVNMLQRFCKSYDVAFDCPTAAKKAAFDKLTSDLLQVGSRPKIAFDEMLEGVATMAMKGAVKGGQEYLVEGEILYLHLNSAIPAYREWAKRTNWEGEVLGRTEYFNQAKELEKMKQTYIVDVSRLKQLAPGNVQRCIVVNLKKAEDMRLDVRSFGYSNEQPKQEWERPVDGSAAMEDPALPAELTEEPSILSDAAAGESDESAAPSGAEGDSII